MSETENATSIDPKTKPPLRLGVLISGRGSNLQAIIDAIDRGALNAIVVVVISNRAGAAGLERARNRGIKTLVSSQRDYPSREDFDRALVAALRNERVELVACAGFMRILSPVMIAAFPDRILNIHPSLLPAFPGLDAQRAALEHGVRITGCTVFIVRAGIDDGPIIIQAAVPVMPTDDEASLSERILRCEHIIYPYAIRLFQEGRVEVRGRTVVLTGPLPEPPITAIINPPATETGGRP